MPTDPSQSRLTQHQQTRQETGQQQTGHTFASVEELLRADRLQHPPPPQLAARLRQTLAQEPPTRRRWWQRWWQR